MEFPEGLTQINEFAFTGCTNLETIKFSSTINKISGNAFNRCIKLKNIEIAKDNKNLRLENGILLCSDETGKNIEMAIILKEGKVFISPLQILGTIETYEILPSTSEGIDVIEIADYAFHGQSKMKNIIIASTIKKIGVSFNYCSSLEKIEIPSSVTDISNSCFSMSQQLKEIIIYNVEGSIAGQPWGCIYGDKAIYWLGK